MSAGSIKMGWDIEGWGYYESDHDLYFAAKARTKPELLTRIYEYRAGDWDSGERTKIRRLRKDELAAIVAYLDTCDRNADRAGV